MKFNRTFVLSLIIMVVITALYRILPNRPLGFAPQLAVALFSGFLFRSNKKYALLMPLLSMLLSDVLYELLFINGMSSIRGFYGGMWLNYLLFVSVSFIGFTIQKAASIRTLVATIASPLAFFLVSNFIVWASRGGFVRPLTMDGLILCYGDGLPFLRGSILATICFSAIFFGVYQLISQKNTVAKASV